jgi:hypothetical protein
MIEVILYYYCQKALKYNITINMNETLSTTNMNERDS